jgi:hypothetical protein
LKKTVQSLSTDAKLPEISLKKSKSLTKTGITRRNICNTLRGCSKSAGGFFWKYDDIPIIEKI